MKLHEITKPNSYLQDAIDWLSGFNVSVNSGPPRKDVGRLLKYNPSTEDVELSSQIRVFEIEAKGGEDGGKWSGSVVNHDKPVLDWYMKKDQPQVEVIFATMLVENMLSAPNARGIELRHCYVKSLAGIEKLSNLKRLFWTYSGSDAPFGVLGLLKLPNLIEIKFTFQMDPNDIREGEEAQVALEIVNKHLKDKNVAECMDELIEAGLKEYAKL
jgi:hypothetical protein